MQYLQWNTLLTEHFFSPDRAGRKVYLFATHDLIDQLGRSQSSDFADFISALKTGPDWARAAGLCQKALQTMKDWRNRALPYPPYVAYLVLFVIAAGHEGDFAPNAYYPRLRSLLGEEPHTGN